MLGLFITGSGTEVGKTYVASLIARQLVARGVRVGVYKPVASGCRRQADDLVSDDAVALWEAAGRPLSLDAVCPQRFEAPLAPHVAARLESRRVDAERLRTGLDVWRDACDLVLVEGAGGLMSPLSEQDTSSAQAGADGPGDYNADLAIDFGFPVIVVVPNRLGVINDALQTVITAGVIDSLRSGEPIHVAGVVLNDASPDGDSSRETNEQELADRLGPPLLGRVRWGDDTGCEADWLALARRRGDDANA